MPKEQENPSEKNPITIDPKTFFQAGMLYDISLIQSDVFVKYGYNITMSEASNLLYKAQHYFDIEDVEVNGVNMWRIVSEKPSFLSNLFKKKRR